MNGFRRLQERLREEGWYVGWNHYCCQTCAWDDVPDYLDAKYNEEGYLIHPVTGEELDWKTRDGVYEEVDLNKVLFNHSQDCEYDWYESVLNFFGDEDDKAEEFMDEYGSADTDEERRAVCEQFECTKLLDELPKGMLVEGSFVCYPPELQDSSLFCFSGDKEGVKNLKAILPIIEECGCTYHWDGTGKSRIEISWELE